MTERQGVVQAIPDFPRETPSSLPPFTVDAADLPGVERFSELFLLGLQSRALNALLRLGTIQYIHEIPEKTFGITKVYSDAQSEIAEKFAVFQQEAEGLHATHVATGAVEPIVINAREWFIAHELTWQGTPKTDRMTLIESFIDEELGTFLEREYSHNNRGAPAIAAIISQASGGEIQLRDSQLVAIFDDFHISMRSKRAARRLQKEAARAALSISSGGRSIQ